MNNDYKHVVHPALIRTPKIAGVSSGFFGFECLFCILIFNFFRVSLITAILIGAVFLLVHPFMRKSQKEDPLALELWVGSVFSFDVYYPSGADINSSPPDGKSCIPSKL